MRLLYFTVAGENGTTGFADVMVPKSLVPSIANIDVYLDGARIPYASSSVSDSWLLNFTYAHSVHRVDIFLGEPVFSTPTPSPTPATSPSSPTPTVTPQPTPTKTPSTSPLPSQTPSPTPTPTLLPTPQETEMPTQSPTESPSQTPQLTPTVTSKNMDEGNGGLSPFLALVIRLAATALVIVAAVIVVLRRKNKKNLEKQP